MSNVNNFLFAKHLDNFKIKILDPQIQRVAEARKIIEDKNYKWADEKQRDMGIARFENYKAWQQVYQTFYDSGLELVKQHETIVAHMAKWYSKWREDVSNEGVQEKEMMSAQADFLNEIFSEMYKDLQPLKLDIKPPAALNLK